MSRVNKLSRILVGACLVLLGNAASAGVIYFDPTPKNALVGDSFSIDLMWDGSGGPDYIGDFDVDISYDDAVVTYDGSVIDPLFAVDSLGCLDCFDFSVPGLGLIDIYEVSLDSVADLIANQASLGRIFPLITLNFTAIADGLSPLTFVGTNTFGDEGGGRITPTLNTGLICVGANCTPVPEPGSLALFGLGLLALARRRLQ